MKTSKKHPKIENLGDKAGSNDFRHQQPSSEAKKRGWEKRASIREMISILMNEKYNFKYGSALHEQLAVSFGTKNKKGVYVLQGKTRKELLILAQTNKAILEADTAAFTALCNQSLGAPKQEVDVNSVNTNINIPIIDWIKNKDESGETPAK